MLEYDTKLIQHEVQRRQNLLQSEESPMVKLEKAEAEKARLKASENILIRSLFRASQGLTGENTIGRLNINPRSSFWMTFVSLRGCATLLEEEERQYTGCLQRWVEYIKALEAAKEQGNVADADQTIFELQEAEKVAQNEFKRRETLRTLPQKNQQSKQRDWIRTEVVPALHQSGLLKTTLIPLSVIVPPPASSIADVSPLVQPQGRSIDKDIGGDVSAAQQDYIRLRNRHQKAEAKFGAFRA